MLDEQGHLVARDHHRERLSTDVAPGQTVAFAFECPAPAAAGLYSLKLDLVAEGVTWFETVGSPTMSRPVQVS